MIRKFFPRDKNYILEAVQLDQKEHLLRYLVDFAKVAYLLRHNPLGVEDDFILRIRQHDGLSFPHLDEFYLVLCGVFRFEFYRDNQLMFDFDGVDPSERYAREWETQFKKWAKQFCQLAPFLRIVLDLTVFYPPGSAVLLVDNRLKGFLLDFFQIRLHPDKGIVRNKVA